MRQVMFPLLLGGLLAVGLALLLTTPREQVTTNIETPRSARDPDASPPTTVPQAQREPNPEEVTAAGIDPGPETHARPGPEDQARPLADRLAIAPETDAAVAIPDAAAAAPTAGAVGAEAAPSGAPPQSPSDFDRAGPEQGPTQSARAGPSDGAASVNPGRGPRTAPPSDGDRARAAAPALAPGPTGPTSEPAPVPTPVPRPNPNPASAADAAAETAPPLATLLTANRFDRAELARAVEASALGARQKTALLGAIAEARDPEAQRRLIATLRAGLGL